MTFPDGWVVLVPSVAGDATAVARLKADLGAKAAMEHSLRHALQTLRELAEEEWFEGLEIKTEEWPKPCGESGGETGSET